MGGNGGTGRNVLRLGKMVLIFRTLTSGWPKYDVLRNGPNGAYKRRFLSSAIYGSCVYHNITCVGLSSKSHWLGFTNYSTTRHLILIAYLPADINVRFMVFGVYDLQ